MFSRGCYGIRVGDSVKTVKYWYRATGRKTKRGIGGGRIDLLQLSIEDRVTAWYSGGRWGTVIADPHSEKALDKLLRKWN